MHASLIGNWDFTDPRTPQRDATGNWGDLELKGYASLTGSGLELGFQSWARASLRENALAIREKTMVVWLKLRRVERPAGAAMSLDTSDERKDQFDAIVLGEHDALAWMPGSNGFDRSPDPGRFNDDAWEAMSAARVVEDRFEQIVQVAITYADAGDGRAEIKLYRNGAFVYGYTKGRLETWRSHADEAQDFSPEILFGPRHTTRGEVLGSLGCTVLAAQLYGEALTARQITGLYEEKGPADRRSAEATFALVIGVEDYTALDASLGRPLGTSDLQGARNDVRSYAMLTRMMGVPAENMRVLAGPRLHANDFQAIAMGREQPIDMNMVRADVGYATREAILEGLDWLADRLRETPNAQGTIFFSGHSATTSAGHPTICPMDTQRRRAPLPDGALDALTHPEAVELYLLRLDVVVGLRGLLESDDAEEILQAFEGLFGPDGRCTRERVLALLPLEEMCSEPQKAATRLFISTMLSRQQIRGTDTWGLICQKLDWLRERGLTRGDVEAILTGDPFAEDPDLTGLISFNRAFCRAFRGVPQDRALTVVLETCLPRSSGGRIHPHYRADAGGADLPACPDGAVILASCGLEQSAYTGVFDNRWHGAFSWAAVSLLSQRTVRLTDQGSCFDLSYGDLIEQIGALLRLQGFNRQTPALWSAYDRSRWPVFGQPGWQTAGLLRPVRRREEISPGTGGWLFAIQDSASPPVQRGWLVVVEDDIPTTNPVWEAGHDYWIWFNAEGAPFPAEDFHLARPADASGSTLEDLIIDNTVSKSGAGKTVCDFASDAFSGSALHQNQHIGNHHKVRRDVSQTITDLSCVRYVNAKLKWYRADDTAGELSGNKLKFNPTEEVDELVLNAGVTIDFIWTDDAPHIDYRGDILTDQ